MVEHPGLVVSARAAPKWSAEGPLAERALAFARRFVQHLDSPHVASAYPPQHFLIESAVPEHVGLGTGTQLGLAVAQLLAESWGLHLDGTTLARSVGRGRRSALGVHGFAHGGFLVEAGKHAQDALSPLVTRLAFPKEWRVVLAMRAGQTGTHGVSEREAFARLTATPTQTDALCRLVLLGLMPALIEEDWRTFGEALFDFNARAGEVFAPVQGGIYANAFVEELVAFVRGQGIAGTGQSSWGPTVFAVAQDEEQAAHLADRLRERFRLSAEEVFTTCAWNQGATLG
jgi:beta-RFAP synthase